VDVGSWSAYARKGGAAVLGCAGGADLRLGFWLEGRTDDELPERVLGCACLSRADLAAAAEPWGKGRVGGGKSGRF